VFKGLDRIDQAIGDVTATSDVLDEIIVNISDGDAKHEAIAHLFRHLQTDLASLQQANAEARAAILRPGERRWSMTPRRSLLAGLAVASAPVAAATPKVETQATVTADARELAKAMARLHGGRWTAHVDHDTGFILIGHGMGRDRT
jgi:hypothetical protein